MQTPDFVPNVDASWGQDQDGAAGEYSPDSYTGEWPETRDTQTDDLDYPEDLEKSTHSFVLYCGAEETHLPSSSTLPSDSPLPPHQWRPPPPRTSPMRNGCGAIVHTAAVPRKRIHGTVLERVVLGTRSRRATAIGVGNFTSLAVDNHGDVWGCGLDTMGQTTTGTPTPSLIMRGYSCQTWSG